MLAREIARTLPIGIANVGVGSVAYQQTDEIGVPSECRFVERRGAALLNRVGRRSGLE